MTLDAKSEPKSTFASEESAPVARGSKKDNKLEVDKYLEALV